MSRSECAPRGAQRGDVVVSTVRSSDRCDPAGPVTGNVQSFHAERRGAALVVDDEPHVRAAMARGLAALGFTVLQAGDASQALTVADALQSSLVIVLSDVMMPGMNGFELRLEMMRRYPSVSVILVSGHTAPELAAIGVRSHDARVLAKPFCLEELEGAIGEIGVIGTVGELE